MSPGEADIELPIEDLKLVNALQIAPRATWAELGAVLGRHPTTLSARWATLRSERMAWVMGHLGGEPGQQCTAFVQVQINPELIDVAMAELCALPQVLTVDDASSTADFQLTCLTPDWLTLSTDVLPLIRQATGVQRMKVSLCTRLFTTAVHWRLNELSHAESASLQRLVPRISSPPTNIPDTFWPMLHLLSRDGRATASEIAQVTGQHPSTVGRALKTAQASGMVTFRCEMASHFTGYPLAVQWFAKIPAGSMDAAVGFLTEHPNLRLCAEITGTSNLMFMAQLRAPAEIATLEAGLTARVPGAVIIESCAGVRWFKRMGWMLDPQGRPTGEVVV